MRRRLVSVPVGDPAFDEVADLDYLSRPQLREIAHFFDVCRDRDLGRDVRTDGHDKVDVARQ